MDFSIKQRFYLIQFDRRMPGSKSGFIIHMLESMAIEIGIYWEAFQWWT